MPTPEDLRLIDHLHGGFPLSERPFAEVGAALGLDEADVIASLQRLLASGVLTRFGPLFQIERAGGLFVLAALAAPEERYAEVTQQVNSLPEVAHNYRREHALNMWFVIGAESPALADAAIARIEALTGLKVYAFPKEREYFVELRLPLLEGLGAVVTPPARPAPASPAEPFELTDFDRTLIAATQGGLPLVPRPYDELAQALGVSAGLPSDRLQQMLFHGLIRRIGAVPNHYRLGFSANGMSVWDVDDAEVDRLGEQVGALPGVSHCYRRPRVRGVWRYNLFAMLHGRSRAEVEAQAGRLRELLGSACRAHDILYSSAILKKTGLRLARPGAPAES